MVDCDDERFYGELLGWECAICLIDLPFAVRKV